MNAFNIPGDPSDEDLASLKQTKISLPMDDEEFDFELTDEIDSQLNEELDDVYGQTDNRVIPINGNEANAVASTPEEPKKEEPQAPQNAIEPIIDEVVVHKESVPEPAVKPETKEAVKPSKPKKTQAPKKPINKTAIKKVGLGLAVAACGLAVYHFYTESIDQLYKASPMVAKGQIEAKPVFNPTQSANDADPHAVTKEDFIAANQAEMDMLLQNYVSQEEMANYLSDYATQGQLSALEDRLSALRYEVQQIGNSQAVDQSEDVQRLDTRTANLYQRIADLDYLATSQGQGMTSLQDEIKSLQKENQRLTKQVKANAKRLKPNKAAPKKVIAKAKAKVVKPTKQVVLIPQEQWVLIGASRTIAFISHRVTKKELTVRRGYEINECGVVLRIDPKNKTVTTDSCVITGR